MQEFGFAFREDSRDEVVGHSGAQGDKVGEKSGKKAPRARGAEGGKGRDRGSGRKGRGDERCFPPAVLGD